MAATLVLEDGTGLANANAYQDATGADTYWADHGAPALWTAASGSAKDAALILGTQYLDAVYGQRWLGFRKIDTQGLDWPRSGGFSVDGYAIDPDSLPVKLKDACSELALRVINGDTLLPDINNPGTISRLAIAVGPLSKDTSYSGGMSQIKYYRIVSLLVAGITTSGQRIGLA
jgi:hypothetical protein